MKLRAYCARCFKPVAVGFDWCPACRRIKPGTDTEVQRVRDVIANMHYSRFRGHEARRAALAFVSRWFETLFEKGNQ